MLKNIFREWWIRYKKFIFLNIIMDIVIVLFGMLSWSLGFNKMFMMFRMINHSQINEFIPISDSERKKRSIIQICVITFICTVLFMLGISGVISVFYKREIDNFSITAIRLWICSFFVLGVNAGITNEANIFSGKYRMEKENSLIMEVAGSLKENVNKDGFFSKNGISLVVFTVSCLLQMIMFVSGFCKIRIVLKFINSYVGTLVISLVIIFLIIDSLNVVRRMCIGDWTEENLDAQFVR